MPPPASHTDWEMTMVMPLGVLANQLVKIEGELRILSMKAADLSGEAAPSYTQPVDSRLETIHEILESINTLLAKLQAELHPKEPRAQFATREPAASPSHKPSSEWDD